eukprot:TRINITY_DN4297_c0_g1_i1.p1 TRINITY_DN4297_c0_g1~~TRINITY_DN4297_c0_g1_i1.p1  ORF type:complete len:1288 (-),score=301.62 TRINITY_DN4297_c0_g1_i1:2000-5287(-)
MATVFRDLRLTGDQLELVASVLVKQMRKVGLQELPPLVYQMLLLSLKGCKPMILKGIVEHFDLLDSKAQPAADGIHEVESESMNFRDALSAEVLLPVEGTVILHVNFAVKQDQDLGRELLKLVKTAGHISPFLLALLLSLARIQRFEDAALDVIKSWIVRCLRDNSRRQHPLWEEGVQRLSPIDNPEDVLLRVVENSSHGWDHITHGVVRVALILIDAQAAARFGGHTDSKKTENDAAIQLGIKVLYSLFRRHEAVRDEILEQIFSRVITRSDAAVRYLELLAKIVNEHQQQIISDFLQRIKESLEYLAYLPPATGSALLTAVQPLLRYSAHFQDYVVLVLRKAMFHREEDARLIAVGGLLQLLIHVGRRQQALTIMASQAEGDATDGAAESFSTLYGEILGYLRRCLTQQAAVREKLYYGLCAISRGRLRDPFIFDILLAQVQRYVDLGAKPVLKIHRCIEVKGDTPVLVEPLGCLLVCVHRCMQAIKSDRSIDSAAVTMLQQVLTQVLQNMLSCELEEFELDKSATYTQQTGEGRKNQQVALQLLSVLDALIEFATANDRMPDVIQLFKTSQQLRETLANPKAEKATKGRKSTTASIAVSDKCQLSFECVTTLVRAVCSDAGGTEGETEARFSVQFQQWVMECISRKLKYESEEESASDAIAFCIAIAPVLLSIIDRPGHVAAPARQAKKEGKSLTLLAAEALEAMVRFASLHDRKCIPDLFAGMQTGGRVSTLSTLQALQRLTLSLIASNASSREADILVNVVGLMLPSLDAECVAQVYNWLEKLCREQQLQHVALVKGLLPMLLRAARGNDTEIACILARDVHIQLGDLEEGGDVQGAGKYHAVNDSTASVTASAVLSFFDSCADELEWVLGLLHMTVVNAEGEKQSNENAVVASGLMVRLQALVTMISELTRSCVIGVQAEQLFKSLTRLFKLLTTVTKYIQSLGTAPSKKFQSLVDQTARNLTDYVYAFVNYCQTTDETEEPRNKIARQERLVPGLVYVIEQYQKHLINLSKASNVNFMKWFKRSTARDFKIKSDELAPAQPAEAEDEIDEGDDDAMDESPEVTTTSKRKSSGTQQSRNKRARNKMAMT